MTEKISVEDAVNEYYRLKNVYETSYYEKYIAPIVKASKKSKREKRVEFSKLPKAECVNCKRNVGTTFSIGEKSFNRVFSAKCGDSVDPCPLNINIVNGKYNTFATEIVRYDDDIDKLKNSTPHIVVGCPGRIYDMMRRNILNPSTIELVVLDEADELLTTGFKEQVYNIFQYFGSNVQVALFSATMPDYMDKITNKFMRDPVRVSVKAESLTLEGISQYYVAVEDDRQKYATLKHLFSIAQLSCCIIYCNSVKRVIDLYEAMKEDEFPVCCIHSGMDSSARMTAFNQFRTGAMRVLISSNV
jgi:hypothetical protein